MSMLYKCIGKKYTIILLQCNTDVCIQINFVNKNYYHNRHEYNINLPKVCLYLIYTVVLILFPTLEFDIDFSNLINVSTILQSKHCIYVSY